MIGANKAKPPTTKQRLSIIVCYIKGHCFCEEIMIDKNNTRNNCRCGRFMLFDWSHVGGYKSTMYTIAVVVVSILSAVIGSAATLLFSETVKK